MYREDKLLFKNKEYLIKIYVERRNSTYLSITRNVNIRVPIFLNNVKREDEINKMKLKFISYLEKNEYKFSPILPKKYISGDVLYIYGKEYILTVIAENRKTSLVRLNENNIIIKIPFSFQDKDNTISKLLNKFISKEFLYLIEDKVNYFNSLYFNKKIKSISLKNNISRFGSCSYDHKLSFSNSLLLAPKEIIDYVIVHELAHTIHHNHSKKFWLVVQKFFPDHKEKSKWLRENRSKLII